MVSHQQCEEPQDTGGVSTASASWLAPSMGFLEPKWSLKALFAATQAFHLKKSMGRGVRAMGWRRTEICVNLPSLLSGAILSTLSHQCDAVISFFMGT